MEPGSCCGWTTIWTGLFLLANISAVSSSQYVLHRTAKAFDAAGAHCFPGVLTTVSTQQEVAQVLGLFSGSAALRKDFVVWVGLKKGNRDCVMPSMPLRGFRWTQDGSQESQVSRWTEEPENTCTAVLCAVLKGEFNGSLVPLWGLIPVSCRQQHGFICKHSNGTVGPEPPAVLDATTHEPQPRLPESTTAASAEPEPSAPGPERPKLSNQDQGPESSPEPEHIPGPNPSTGPPSGLAPATGSCQNPIIPGARSLRLDRDDGSRIRVQCWSSVQLDLFCGGQPAEWRLLDDSRANFSDVCQPCAAGFHKNASGHCEDVDECSTGAPCRHTCLNTEGSFRCVCVDPSGRHHDAGAPPCDDAATAETAGALSGVLVPALLAVAALVLLALVLAVTLKCCWTRRSKKHAVKKAEKMSGLAADREQRAA